VNVVAKDHYGWRLSRIDDRSRISLRALLIKLVCAVIVLAAFLVFPIASHASVNIPLDSPFYEDLDLLIAQGLIQSDLGSTKPITRAEAGRLLAEAGHYAQITDIPPATERLLDRLHVSYEKEISEAQGWGERPSTFLKPVDELSIAYHLLDGPFSMFNNEGIDYFDGNNATVRLQSEARLWRVFSFYIEPIGLYQENVQGIEGNNDSSLKLHKGYIKFTVDNFEFEWGKDTLWWGPGYHGALLISNNARPFDLYKISNPQATLLPWIFSYLGPFRYQVFFSELDDESTSGHPPNSKLFGARVNFKPHPLFELGMSYLTHFGGDRPGIEGLDLSDYYYIIFSNECRTFDKRDSNKQAAIDAAFTIPGVSDYLRVMDSLTLYAEWGGEDQGTFPDKRAYLAGIECNNVLGTQDLTLRAEYARISPKGGPNTWYTHSVWPMTHYGRVFGHHAGTDSDDLFLELAHKIKEGFFYTLSFDRERSGLDKKSVQKKHQYVIEAGYQVKQWLAFRLTVGHEKISNMGNVEGVEEENSLIATEVEFRF
jgi:hypothetical protein